MAFECLRHIQRQRVFGSGPRLAVYVLVVLAVSLAAIPDGNARLCAQLLTSQENLASEIFKNYESRRDQNIVDPQTQKAWNARNSRHQLFEQFNRLATSPEQERSQDLLYYLEIEDLILLAQKPELVFALHLQASWIDPKVLHETAKLLYLIHLIDATQQRSTYFSNEQFTTLTKIEGLEPKIFDRLYRIATRSPEEIRKARGFYPNKPLGTIFEHTAKTSQGRGFVSTSTQAGNAFNLLIGPILLNARKTQKLTPENIVKANQHTYSGQREIYEVFEYAVSNQLGVKPHQHALIEGEQEITTPFIPDSNIKEYRTVRYVLDIVRSDKGTITKLDLILTEYSDWQDFVPTH